MKTVEVAKAAEVREGEVLVAKAEGHSIALTRVDGVVRAFETKCPHLGLPLAKGKMEGCVIRCPFHGSTFDVCTGKNVSWVTSLGSLSLPQWMRGLVSFGKKAQPIATYAVQEEAGKVSVQLPG